MYFDRPNNMYTQQNTRLAAVHQYLSKSSIENRYATEVLITFRHFKDSLSFYIACHLDAKEAKLRCAIIKQLVQYIRSLQEHFPLYCTITIKQTSSQVTNETKLNLNVQ